MFEMSAQIANVSLCGGNIVDTVVMVAFLNSWMHAWMKTEIGLYSNAAAGFWPKAHFLYLLPFLEKPIHFCLFNFQHTFDFGLVWNDFSNTGFVLGAIH